MIDISRALKLILKLILKRFSILILYTYRNDRVKKLTETVIEMTLKLILKLFVCLFLKFFHVVLLIYWQ